MIRAYGKSDIGKRRARNEDSFFVDNELGLFVVADGMGGHRAGDIASATAIAVAVRTIRAGLAGSGSRDPGELVDLVTRAVNEASAEVFRAAAEDPRRDGMGCTLTLLLAAGCRAVMAHVGDSRLYLFRDKFAIQLSSDHTMAQGFANQGAIKQSEVRNHRLAHVLLRAVGQEPEVDVETRVVELLRGDRFILCSDGLSTYADDPSWLHARLDETDALETAPDRLIEVANHAGGRDNITVIVAGVDARPRERGRAAPARRRERPSATPETRFSAA